MAYLENFHYQILGNDQKPKLVFLHGLLGSGNNWRKITTSLKDDYHMLIFDQRGHGRSFQPEYGYAPEDYAGDLHKILEELGWNRIHLVGHSMGGRNALAYAHRYPETLISLTIEDIGPTSDRDNVDKIERLLGLVPTPFTGRNEAREFFENDFPKRLMGNERATTLANYFYTNIAEQPDGSFSWRFSLDGVLKSLAEGRAKDRWDEVEQLKGPVLWIRGEHSEDLTREVFDQVLKRNPKIQGVEVKDSGHWVHFDQVEEFTQILSDFLSKANGV